MDEFWDQWNKIPRAGKFLIVVLLWAAAGIGYYFAYYEEQVQQFEGLANQFRQVRQTREKHQSIARNLPRWEAEIARLRGELAKAERLLPKKKEIPDLLKRIDDLSKRSGLRLNRFKPKKEQTMGFYAKVPMDMEVSGTFYEIVVFFDKVSNLDRIVNVMKIRLERPALKNQKLVLTSRFQIVTYRFTHKK